MKKLIDALIQSNLSVQIFGFSFYRLLNIIFRVQVAFLFLLIILFSRLPNYIPFQSALVFGLKVGFLWIIANLAKPSVLYPSYQPLLSILGLWLFSSLSILLYSLSLFFFQVFFWGL